MDNFTEKGLASRYSANPIISAKPTIPWSSIKVYNPAVVKGKDGIIHLIFRAIGNDWKSRLGYATTQNNREFTIHKNPVFQPTELYEIEGTEDPRVTHIDGQYVMAYTAYDGKCARLALATSPNLLNWTRLGPILPTWTIGFWQSISHNENNWSKAGALFPEKINNHYLMFFGDHHIWPAYSSNLTNWKPSEHPVLSPRQEYFDAGYIEMGPPPIKTDQGWLVLYHGIQRLDDVPHDPRIYRLGAALFDIANPEKLLWRCSRPLLEPKGDEQIGLVDALQYEGGFDRIEKLSPSQLQQKIETGDSPLAIFCCGAFLENNIVHMYYSSMDTAINLAIISLQDILEH